MKKVCVVTGSRAEYHLLSPLMKAIQADPELKLILAVTGSHLSEQYGNTYRDIERDGFCINEKVPILSDTDDAAAINQGMSRALLGFSEVFGRVKPDMVVLLGDRYELLPIAAAAINYHIPIAHLHGGETTEGAVDECIRHAVTKMSYLHFTSCEAYRRRVIQLGESPDRVFNVGAIGLENIRKQQLWTLAELERSLNFSLEGQFGVVTFHPVTLEKDTAGEQFENLLQAIDRSEGLRIIFTKANADSGGMCINRMIDEYVGLHSDKAAAVFSLGMTRYFTALKYAAVVIGNSSSGIIETPSFRVPTVNIGNRQKGRIQAKNIINCEPETNEIFAAISKALSEKFKNSVQDTTNPYGDGEVSGKIVVQIKRAFESGGIQLEKNFYDISSSSDFL